MFSCVVGFERESVCERLSANRQIQRRGYGSEGRRIERATVDQWGVHHGLGGGQVPQGADRVFRAPF